MTCAEFLEQCALHALGAVEPAEAAALEEHVRRSGPHDGCVEALAKARAEVATLDAALPPPPDGLFARIEADVFASAATRAGTDGDDAMTVPVLKTEVPAAARPTPFDDARTIPMGKVMPLRPSRAPWVVSALAVAAAVALIPWGFGLRGERDEARARAQMAEGDAGDLREVASKTAMALSDARTCRGTLEELTRDLTLYREAVALLEAPGTHVVALAPQGAHKAPATVVFRPGDRRAIVLGSSFAIPAGKAAQLWVIRGKGAPIPAGFVHALPGGLTVGDFDRALLEQPPDAFAVSIEPVGGSKTPTEVVLVGAAKG